jgi:hypothetical protein
MTEISEEDVNAKNDVKFSIKLKGSLDSSDSSQNDDDIFFSSNFLMNSNNNFLCKTAQSQRNKKSLFDSEDLYIKKKLFSSEVQKSDNKKSSDAKSTEPVSIKVKNFNSPKKKYSIFKLIEKEKRSKKDLNKYSFINEKEKEKEIKTSPEKKERLDIFGNVISKKNKKNVRISFIDKVTSQPLVNIVEIESFKNYNYIFGMPKEQKIDKSTNCQCCLIF